MLAALALSLMSQAGPTQLLLIDLDDVGFDLLRETPTPNLDWLEANGRFYTNFTTSPVCSPTRAMVHSGAFPSNPDLLLGQNVDFGVPYAMPLNPLEPMAAAVAGAGFSTAKVGKWHLAPLSDPTHVQRAGFQIYTGALSNLATDGMTGDYLTYAKWVNGTLGRVVGRYLTTDEANDAIRLMQANISFISVSFHAPHAPFHDPPPDLHTISPLVTIRDQARAALQACDTELGRVLSVAITEGYPIIVFSDNGTPQPAGGFKGTLFEGGINNPMWAYTAPGMQPAFVPGVDATLLSAADIYDTVLEHFGVDASLATRGPDSMSFQSSLRGAPRYRRWAYAERFPTNGTSPAGSTTWRRALRTERFKLMRNQTSQGDRLFDLSIDPLEANDLLGTPPLSSGLQLVYDGMRAILASL